MTEREKVIKGLECCLEDEARDLKCWEDGDYPECPYNDRVDGCMGRLNRDALALLKAQEPRVMTLEEVKEARICWIEERDVGIVYPAIYECIGNPSKYGQFSVFTVVPDADILPEELDDDEKIVCDFEEGHRWLWEADYNDVWRCWTSRPTDEQREAVKWG